MGDAPVSTLEKQAGEAMRWRKFMRSHLELLAPVHFFTMEVWIAGGLMTDYLLTFKRIQHVDRAAEPNAAEDRV